ncbi:hypothetical protein AAG570_006464, partial [Ranatra chinensis]
ELEAKALLNRNDITLLKNIFLKRIEFGTAGLRGRMGPGYSQMNDLVIIQTAEGLLKYLLATDNSCKHSGIVIGYDGRHNSSRFAKISANIFLRGGVKVYLFSKICPTPFVPFAVTHFGCSAGVMVTASHNPKEDNGYKVYWNNGAQIIPPHDKGISECILECLESKEESWDLSILDGNTLLIDPLPELMESYYNFISERIIDSGANAKFPVTITYTPMHGVGYPYVVEAFRVAGFKELVPVKEQVDPDPEFSTVKFPNPEEGKSALDLSMKAANECCSTLILANDPDADRLAVAEKMIGGDWKVFTGNELGALLGWWEIYTYKQSNPNADLSKVYVISSTVSSKIVESIAKVEEVQFEETLTGFKWMGNKSYELIQQGCKVLFAFEEAIGFMCGTAVLDKDGVSAAVRVAELASYLFATTGNPSLINKLEEIYLKYGYHISNNSYFICHHPEVIKRIFERLRNFKGELNTYPGSIMEGKHRVTWVRDLTTGFDSSKPDKKATLPVSKSSQMVTFGFDNGLVATLRTSGTEPKIKYYTELCASPSMR